MLENLTPVFLIQGRISYDFLTFSSLFMSRPLNSREPWTLQYTPKPFPTDHQKKNDYF